MALAADTPRITSPANSTNAQVANTAVAYDGALYGELLGMLEPMMLAMGDDAEAKDAAEMLKVTRELYAKMFGRLAMQMVVTQQGIELIQQMEMPTTP